MPHATAPHHPAHNHLRLRHAACALSVALLGLGSAHAADDAAPKLHSAGKLQYTCGGIGKDESTAMRAAMKDYPLALLFAGKDGEYLADLKVDIQPASGEAAQFTASGPVCLVKLADGAYTVTVTAPEGAKQSKKVDAGKGSKSLDFRF